MEKKSFSSFFLLILFLGFVFFLIFLALTHKVVGLIQKSSFNQSSFTVLVVSKDANIVHFDRGTNSLSVIVVPNARRAVLANTNIANSILLHTLINGKIVLGDFRINDFRKDFFTMQKTKDVFFQKKDFMLSGLNEIDFLKMYLFTKFLKNSDMEIKKLESLESFSQQSKIDDMLYEILKDEAVINEKVSIEIVNSSDINGLGGKIAQVLTNAGFNVVSVVTSDTASFSKIIRRVDKSKTSSMIKNIFQFPEEIRKESAISDITVIMGEDMRRLLQKH